MTDKKIVLVTVPDLATGETIGNIVVQERLAACAQILPGLVSIYRWKGNIEKSPEHLLIIKTRADLFESLEKRILGLHPYQVPQIVCLSIEQGFQGYLQWIDDCTA